MSNYPGGLDEFTRKIDGQDTILANDVNELQESVENIEEELGTDPAGSFDTVKDRLDDIDDQLEAITIDDTDVNLSSGNVGDHSTLDEHVKDSNIHASLDALAYNYPRMLDQALDELLRGVMTSGYPLNTDSTATSSAFNLDKGDVVYCHPTANPSSSSYGWYMVTSASASLASTSSLRLNDEADGPSFSDGSRITRLQFDESYAYDDTVVDISGGDLIFAHPVANPSSSSYGWFMATADASASSEIRLNDEGSAPTFATDSQFSKLKITDTAISSDTSMGIKTGDIVFCYPSANPTGSGYGWHVVTTGTTGGVAGTDLRLDGAVSAPSYTGSRFSKFVVTGSALSDDTSLPIKNGDLAFCYTTADPTGSGYDWHMVKAGDLGVAGTGLVLDDEDSAPTYSSGSRFSRLTSEKYQGVAVGGEIVEIVYVPDWFILTSVGTGTNPGSTGTAPGVYGNISLKLPIGSVYGDEDFTGNSLILAGSGDPLSSAAYRCRISPVFGCQEAYSPEVGMRIKLNTGAGSAAVRGIKGAEIENREIFGNLCNGNPTIKVYAPKLSSSSDWLCSIPLLVRILDNNDNSHLDVGDFALMVISSQGSSDSPCISTDDEDCNGVDIFNLPSGTIYTGTGADGELVIDGTYASNSSDGIAYPGGQLEKPENLASELLTGGSFPSGSSYYYRISALDAYGEEADATAQFQVDVDTDNSRIKLTWDSTLGNNGYSVYGRSNGDTKFMRSVSSEEYIDDGSDTPVSGQDYPSVNSTDGCYLLDCVGNFTNVTLQNGGVMSCTDWSSAAQTNGRIVFYATGTVDVDSTSRIDVVGKGYRGGAAMYQGESYTGVGVMSAANNGGGGGSAVYGGTYGSAGGGYGTIGEDCPVGSQYGEGGETYGTEALDILYRGSGAGNSNTGNGGGIVMISADEIVVEGSGSITADGESGSGGGSGGSIYLRANTLNVGIDKVSAVGADATNSTYGGDGGDGRIRFDFVSRGISESNPVAFKYQI